mmetsp:Transcript_30880/g.78200  ORF Transcript_30880/g.78200 Transcript_30880/m.78200 type:complete len:223 (-) Transcript_30880:307-975(-)
MAAERFGRRRGTRRLLLGMAARAEAPKPHAPQQPRAPLRAAASQHIVLQVAATYGLPFCDVSRSPPFANPSAWSNRLHAFDWRQFVLYRHDVHLDIRVARVLGEASGVEDGLRTVWHEVEAVHHATCHGANYVLFGHVNAPGEDAVLVLDAAFPRKQSSLVQTRRQQLHSTSHLRGWVGEAALQSVDLLSDGRRRLGQRAHERCLVQEDGAQHLALGFGPLT